jgi:Concanavalin A-like lectin/glucanases superfamily
MRTSLLLLVVLSAFSLSLSLAAQDILHYKFDAGCGTEVINFADGSTVGTATMVSTLPNAPASSWTTGRWRGGMTGSTKTSPTADNYITTGWNIGSFSGSFSISMWIRNKPGNPLAIAFGYLFGATGSSFRCFTGSSGKLFVGGWGGTPSNLVNAADLTSLLNKGYVHVALVVDASNSTATYYINGVADQPISLTGSVAFSGTDFSVGKYATSTTSSMDFDEFLFTRRVLTVTDVKRLASSQQAGAGAFGTRNVASLRPGGGRPSLGNANFQLTISDPNATPFLLFIGSNRCKLSNTYNLPMDLGTIIPVFSGVLAYTDIDLLTLSGILLNGTAVLRLPVPNDPRLAGYCVYLQAYTATAQNQLRGTNAVAVTPGS